MPNTGQRIESRRVPVICFQIGAVDTVLHCGVDSIAALGSANVRQI
jgi:hypothetical protein